jgi:hypothetical protein
VSLVSHQLLRAVALDTEQFNADPVRLAGARTAGRTADR